MTIKQLIYDMKKFKFLFFYVIGALNFKYPFKFFVNLALISMSLEL